MSFRTGHVVLVLRTGHVLFILLGYIIDDP